MVYGIRQLDFIPFYIMDCFLIEISFPNIADIILHSFFNLDDQSSEMYPTRSAIIN